MSVTTLPSLHVGGKVTQQVIKHTPQPPASKSSKSARPNKWNQNRDSTTSKDSLFGVSFTEKKTAKKRDSIIDTARYRSSYKHNLCLDMLQEGFHQAFCQLFNLLEKENKLFNQGDNEVMVQRIEDQPEKLDTLKENLIIAEIANRRGRLDQAYRSQLTLAEYFSIKGDSWLSNHFYYKCLDISLKMMGDGRRTEAEANYNLGISSEKDKKLDQAVTYMEIFYTLSKDKNWENVDGENLHKNGCESLNRMYTTIAEQIEEGDPDQAIEYLKKAFDMAKEGANEKHIGTAGFRLGQAYDENGAPDAAIKYFVNYLEICNTARDDVGKGQAYQALARAHHVKGDVNNAIQYLTMFLDTAERMGQKEARSAACSGLGALHNSLGQHVQASEYFRQAFESSKEGNKPDMIEDSRTEFGICSAHELFDKFTSLVVQNDKAANTRVMTWRDSRSELSVDEPATTEKDRDEAISSDHVL